MSSIKATKARANLYGLIDQVCKNHEPIRIEGKRGAAVLLSEEDYLAIEETLYLIAIPGMRESIREGIETPIEACETELPW